MSNQENAPVKKGRGRPKGALGKKNKEKTLLTAPIAVTTEVAKEEIITSIEKVSNIVEISSVKEITPSSPEVSSDHQAILTKARSDIQKVIDQNGRYTHNLLGLVLRKVASQISTKAANDLIDEFFITERFDIKKVS